MTKFGKLILFGTIVLVLIIVGFFLQKKTTEAPALTEIPSNPLPQNDMTGVLGNKDDLINFSIVPNVNVHGVLSYRGTIKGGYFFEGNILINILDANKNVLKKSNAVAKTDWMTAGPVDFEGNIDFSGLPAGSAYFEIHNDNASGLPENDKSILIPVVIQ